MTQNTSAAQISKAQELVAAADTGAHHPAGGVGRMLTVTAILWTLFQLWVASPLPYHFTWLVPVLNLDDTKIVHLAFAFFSGLCRLSGAEKIGTRFYSGD